VANPLDIGRAEKTINDNISVADLAYIAGFVDGEGTISIVTAKRRDRIGHIYHRPLLSIHNTDRPILEWIKITLGVGMIHASSIRGVGRKQVYKYAVHCSTAIQVAALLLPYLRVKRTQAEMLIKFADTLVVDYKLTHKKLGADILSIRSKQTEAIQSLNKRGVAI
jgi:hypothetical protein